MRKLLFLGIYCFIFSCGKKYPVQVSLCDYDPYMIWWGRL